jgi:hypothetical protein
MIVHHWGATRHIGPRLLTALVMLLGLLLQSCGGTNQQSLSVGDPAPSFSLPSATGGTTSLSDYVGKQPVLLYFSMGDG